MWAFRTRSNSSNSSEANIGQDGHEPPLLERIKLCPQPRGEASVVDEFVKIRTLRAGLASRFAANFANTLSP